MISRMNRSDEIAALEEYATSERGWRLVIRRAAASLDERQDGEAVTRIVLLLDDPDDDTWDVEAVRALREELGRKATDLDLPPVSVTLVPRSEAEAVDAFA